MKFSICQYSWQGGQCYHGREQSNTLDVVSGPPESIWRFRVSEGSVEWASCAQRAGAFSSMKTPNKWELEEMLLRCSFEAGICCLLNLNYTKLDKERQQTTCQTNCQSANTLLSKYKTNPLLTLTVPHASKKGMMCKQKHILIFVAFL